MRAGRTDHERAERRAGRAGQLAGGDRGSEYLLASGLCPPALAMLRSRATQGLRDIGFDAVAGGHDSGAEGSEGE